MPVSSSRHKPGKGARPTVSSNASHSRMGTPSALSSDIRASSATSQSAVVPYLIVDLESGRPISDTVVEAAFEASNAGAAVPTSTALKDMHENLKGMLMDKIYLRSEACDRLVRELARKRKERIERNRERERAKRVVQEADERSKKRLSKKRQREEDKASSPGSTTRSTTTANDMEDVKAETIKSDPDEEDGREDEGEDEDEEDGDENDEQDKDSHIPKFTFGPNPLTFPDPTIYHIRDIDDSMPPSLKKEIYSVTGFPATDLSELTPGTPPDKDYSTAKPASQVSAQAFANYVDSFIRSLTEEDLNFLRERGDRLTPFVIPPRGPRHYKDIWADEDGAMSVDSDSERYPLNEARGNVDMIDDEVGETDQVSLGPVMSRLLMAMLPDPQAGTGLAGSDSSDSGVHTEMTDEATRSIQSTGQLCPPACALQDQDPESSRLPPNGTPSFSSRFPPAPEVPLPTFEKMEDRVLAELRHIGFIDDSTARPEFDSHYDDEVAARLRMLQEELRNQSLLNGARKTRLLELAEMHMAMQEYNNIADDLDSQLNSAYLKRSRALGKGKKNVKRGVTGSGAGGGAGPSAPAPIGDSIRALMERRKQWKNVIGPVFSSAPTGIPNESVFDRDTMVRLIERENATWAERDEEDEQDDEGVAV